MAITTAMCTSFKSDLFSALHNFNVSGSFTATGVSTISWTAVSALTNLAVGMALTGTNVATNTVIARITGASTMDVSVASTGAIGTVNFTGDTWKAALIKVAAAGTYGASSTNYTDVTGNTDETSGTGYTAGGNSLTNVSPTTSGTTAFVDFADTSWTTASFSTIGCVIYNNNRRGPVATRAASFHDFAGTQTVTVGTFTLVFPTPDSTNAILRLA